MRGSLGVRLTGWMLLLGVTGTVRAGEIELVPVGANGAHTIVGNEIRLANPGQRVFLEVRVSGWDPTGVQRLQAWQATIDSSGYSNGTAGVLTVASAACGVSGDCPSVFGGACSVGGAVCNVDSDCPFPQANPVCLGGPCNFPSMVGGFCSPAFILSGREDYVFKGLVEFPIVALDSPDFAFASAVLSEFLIDPGTSLYAATLVLDVPANASGVYEIGFLGALESRLQGVFDVVFEPLTLTPARIMVAECALNSDCNDNNACTTDTCRIDDTCGHSPNFDANSACCDPLVGDLCSKARGVAGDGDGDGRVDLRDFATHQSRCFGTPQIPFRCEPFDTDCNCRLDVSDLPGFVTGMNGPVAP